MPVGELARSPRLTWPSAAAEGNRHLLPEALIAERVARVGRCADFLQLHRLRFAAEQLQIRCSSVHLVRTKRKKDGMGSDQIAAGGMLFYGEPLGMPILLGAAVIFAGTYYSIRRESRKPGTDHGL